MKFRASHAVTLGIAAFYLLLSSHGLSAMDRVRVETKVDAALAKYGVTGSNVLVAILDRGIDWKNNDFRNPDGTTRVEYIFDLSDNTGSNAPGNPFGLGTIYTKAQINGALLGGTNLNTRDAVGHGTTTTGIAAGGGRNLALYRGVAPEARLLIVKLVSEGAPAHDGEPAEAAFGNANIMLPIGINFAVSKAAELGLPCVMLLNNGAVANGPTDGTSTLARKVDTTFGAGKPGLVFVTGAGDYGGVANRAGGTVAQGGIVTIEIQKEIAGALAFDLWYPETDRFDVRVHTPGGISGPYLAPAGAAASGTQTTSEFLYYHLGRDVDFFNAANQKREIWIRFTGPPGLYKVELTGTSVTGGRFDATLSPSAYNASGSAVSHFLTHVAPGSIKDLATATNGITLNSYVGRTNWIDIDGISRTINQGALGGLWNGSAVGPTFDGRLGIDVSAPGDSLFTTYNPRSYFATFRFNLVQGSDGNYGRASAVSAADPIVVGIIALLLEMDPTLDAAEIKELLHAGARADSSTGALPNPRWGYGKVDALASLDLLHDRLTRLQVSNITPAGFRISSRGQNGKTYFFEKSTNLTDWSPLSAILAGTNLFGLDVMNAESNNFFRLTR